MKRRPLDGLRIIAVESYGAGPFGTMQLADLGAEVIKIENPGDGGDISRQVGPFFDEDGESLFFQSFNRNKRSLTLDLKHPEGTAVLHDLVKTADAIFNNLRGDLPAKLGLTYAELGQINPRVVCIHLSAYGREGSRRNWPGYDYLMQAETGYMQLTGEPQQPPARCGVSVIDMMAGLTAAYALLAGVLEARAVGHGRDLDVNLYDTALASTNYLSGWHLNRGYVPPRLPRSAHPSLGPTQLYRTRDGWIFLMCQKEKFWRLLIGAIGQPELLERPEFRDMEARRVNRDQLTTILDAALMAQTTNHWLKIFAGRVPAAPVLDLAGALDSQYVKERERVLEMKSVKGKPLRMIAGGVTLSDVEARCEPPPGLGGDTAAILESLAYTPQRIKALREAGVV